MNIKEMIIGYVVGVTIVVVTLGMTVLVCEVLK